MPRSYRNLRKGLIRPDWNKHTLFQIATNQASATRNQTFFQQKWAAKSRLRGYHSPHVREKSWARMFDRRLPAVVPMNYRYLARHDGSELATGRGSGLIKEQRGVFTEIGGEKRRRTPYMNMAFYPLERRLDNVIFRALFASSVQQARSMVLHGGVSINGKKMRHPGYRLNPGDLFQVEPERVLYATGATRPMRAKAKSKEPGEEAIDENNASEETSEGAEAKADAEDVQVSMKEIEHEVLDIENAASTTAPRRQLLALRAAAIQIASNGKRDLPAAKLQNLRTFRADALKALSNMPKTAEADDNALAVAKKYQEELIEITKSMPDRLLGTAAKLLRQQTKVSEAETEAAVDKLVEEAIAEERENPHDESKPYATPWKPRKYMSAFAFIPRYLEVNQNICAGVYLRDPVARPGLAEVPTPFDDVTNQLGFNWYLRRG